MQPCCPEVEYRDVVSEMMTTWVRTWQHITRRAGLRAPLALQDGPKDPRGSGCAPSDALRLPSMKPVLSFFKRLGECICLGTAIVVGLAIGAGGAAAQEPPVLRIGLMATLSGPAAVYGEHLRDGFMLAVDQSNGALGGRGRSSDHHPIRSGCNASSSSSLMTIAVGRAPAGRFWWCR